MGGDCSLRAKNKVIKAILNKWGMSMWREGFTIVQSNSKSIKKRQSLMMTKLPIATRTLEKFYFPKGSAFLCISPLCLTQRDSTPRPITIYWTAVLTMISTTPTCNKSCPKITRITLPQLHLILMMKSKITTHPQKRLSHRRRERREEATSTKETYPSSIIVLMRAAIAKNTLKRG
jgi:hypothetical protein